MAPTHLVAVKVDVSTNVRRLLRMRTAELELTNAEYVAALIIQDTVHLGSMTGDIRYPDTEWTVNTDDETKDHSNGNGDAAA